LIRFNFPLHARFVPNTPIPGQKAIRSLPGDYGFEWEIPGFAFFDEIVTRLRNFLTVVGEVGVLALIICRRGLHEAQLLAFFSLMLPAIMLLKPSSGVGGAGEPCHSYLPIYISN
jgi:hypothetical protein